MAQTAYFCLLYYLEEKVNGVFIVELNICEFGEIENIDERWYFAEDSLNRIVVFILAVK